MQINLINNKMTNLGIESVVVIVVSPLFSSLRQIWQMTSLIDTRPVCLNDKKRVEQNGEHKGCFPRRLEYV